MRSFALVAAAAAATVGAQSCQVRLINTYPATATLTIGGGANGTAVSISEQAQGISVYYTLPCSAAGFTITMSDGKQTAGVLPALNTACAQTIVAFPNGLNAGSPLATSYVDNTAVMPDATANIEQCWLRVINTGSLALTVNGVTGECYNCLHPNLGVAAANGGYMPYQQVFCGVPYSVQVESADHGVTWPPATETLPLVEHGSYTVVVSPPATTGNPPTMVFVTDVEGPWPFWPLVTTPFILIGLSLVHWLVGFALVKTGACNARYEAELDDPKAASSKEVTIMNFFGWDHRIRKAIKARRAADAAGRADIGSGGYTAKLLPGGDAEAPAAGAAASTAGALAAGKPSASNKPRTGGRIRAIDTLRGLSLCLMIFVNSGAANYMLLDHAKWNGLHLADLLFPTFVFTQGMSMAISFDGRRKRGSNKWTIAKEVFIRACKLYFLGCFVNNGNNLGDWRLLGVLQYFAISYLVVGLLETFVRPFGEPASSDAGDAASAGSINGAAGRNTGGFFRGDSNTAGGASDAGARGGVGGAIYNDLLRYALQWVTMGILGTVYLCVQYLMPVDGCPTGYIGPGGLADQGAYMGLNCTGGAHRAVDVAFFGPFHMYHWTDANHVAHSSATCADAGMAYNCDVYDPEGVLGWISAAWMCFLGLQAGRVFITLKEARAEAAASDDYALKRSVTLQHVLRWLAWGIPIGLIGGALCGFSKETGLIPINKNLWSPSFVAVLAGIDYAVLATLFIVVDVWKTWSGSPFCYVGMNSIVTYVGSETIGTMFPFQITAGVNWINHSQAMVSNVVGVASWVGIARFMYIKKIFINV